MNLQRETVTVGQFELSTLIAIKQLKDNAYGSSIWSLMEEIEGRRITSGAIYTTLKRLANKELINGTKSDPLKEKGGKARIYYHLSMKGHKAIDAQLTKLKMLTA